MKKLILLALMGMLSCEKPTEKGVVPKGNRKLGVHVTETRNGDFNNNFLAAQSAGMDVIPQTFYWTNLEPDNYFKLDWLHVFNIYYPAQNVAVSLNITPVATINKDFPKDIAGKRFNDPIVIARFKNLLDTIHKYSPDIQLNNILIGNEVDLYLSQHPSEWLEFKEFYDSAIVQAKRLWGPQIKVGVENTVGSIVSEHGDMIKKVNENSDIIAFTYYPLNADFTMQHPDVIFNELEKVAQQYPARELFLEECGYASSPVCNSSEELQKLFVDNVFKFWDQHADRLHFVGFLWLNDLPEETAQFYVKEYGMEGQPNQEAFKEYLRTTGLRSYDGKSKKGFEALKTNARARGWEVK